MTDLRKAAEEVLEAYGWDISEPRNKMLRERMDALRQALAQPVDAVPGFTATEPRQSLSRMRPGDRFILVRTSEIYHIKQDGSQWNETRQRPARLHKNSQVRLIVDAVNMSQERVDETAKGEHEYVLDCPRCGHCCQKREWVGLTDEEMKDALVSVDAETKRLPPGFRDFAKAIEAFLKEKNT